MTKNEAISFIESELRVETVCDRFVDRVMDVEVAVFRNGLDAVIVFRCTDSSINWRSNFLFAPRTVAYNNSSSKIRVHTGFYQSYVGSVRGMLQGYMNRLASVVVVGHSLGGALATLCAVDLQYNFPSMAVSAMTFGSPRVGNRWFCSSYDRRVPHTWRYKYGGDVVCSVPLGIQGYSHVSRECHIGPLRLLSFRDHALSNYREP